VNTVFTGAKDSIWRDSPLLDINDLGLKCWTVQQTVLRIDDLRWKEGGIIGIASE
jgi:hypothetical protein